MREDSPEFPRDGLYIGRVHYIDYRTHGMPPGNALWPVVHKRRPYAFEREVRLVMQPFALNEEVGATANRQISQLNESLTPDDSNRLIREIVRDVAPAGYDVSIDPAMLIEEVVVAPQAPDWLLQLIQDVTKRYGIDVPVSRSDLDTDAS
jgi:hypothetical protein